VAAREQPTLFALWSLAAAGCAGRGSAWGLFGDQKKDYLETDPIDVTWQSSIETQACFRKLLYREQAKAWQRKYT